MINSGTISAGSNSGLWNDGTITTLTNSGNIKALGGNFGLKNVNGTIGTLTNSGTISASGNYGLYNDGTATITTLTNTGTISASGNGIGIWNDTTATFTTLNNSQGASSSALTFDKKLPTNYNVIVNSAADYGKIVFSSVSGTTNFGIDSSSTLAGNTTYSAVIDGLSSGDIASGTSGTFTYSGADIDWTLDNSAGTTWDLVTAAAIATGSTNTSITTHTKENVLAGLNNLNYVTEVNFANMNTYDCDLFGENNICLSFGGRQTRISNPDTQLNGVVLVGGLKLDDTFRMGAFFHSNIDQKTQANLELSDKTPLLGGFLVWKEKGQPLGYQLKLAYAWQKKEAILTRAVVGDSEKGRGQTEIGAENFVAELQYSHRLNDNTIVRLYCAARQALISQNGYTETGINSPLTFNKINDKSSTLLLGTKFDMVVTPQLLLKGSMGIEHDMIHTVDRIEPTGLTGLTTVNLEESFNRTRPVVSAGWDYYISSYQRWSGVIQYQELPYQAMTESNVYIYYTMGV